MGQFLAALDGAWRVLAIGLVLGAGLPVLFAYGMRALSWSAGGEARISAEGEVATPRPVGRVIAYTLFALTVLLVLAGVGYVAAHGLGWSITFNGVVPVITHK